MKKYFVATALVAGTLMVTGAGCSYTNPDTVMVKPEEKMENQEMVKDENKMMENETTEIMMKDESEKEETAMKKESGEYTMYEPSKLALAAQGPVVLFFHAPWCPTCKAADADINANLAAIPAGTTILKVDYDTNPELKKKYGVTYQHTFVQVDANGTMLKKWSGGNTLASITAQIK